MDRYLLLQKFRELNATIPGGGYNAAIENLRETEYPQLRDATYLDHAGTAVPASSLIDAVADDLKRNLYGNPHSENPSSVRTTLRIDAVRQQVLQIYNADPEEFDVVFVANATAAIRLVGDAFVGAAEDNNDVVFDFVGHSDAHTSLVALRNMAGSSITLNTPEFEDYISKQDDDDGRLRLVAYPAQSNFSGNRLPLSWPERIRQTGSLSYVLLDAAALVTTSPLNLGDADNAPDFIAVSFYKIFGMPDLGALIVRRKAADIFQKRRFYGGGTLEFVMNPREHPTKDFPNISRKSGLPHSFLEDGTVPFHSISALGKAIEIHGKLYGSFARISSHSASLAHFVHEHLRNAMHYNGQRAAEVYTYHSPSQTYLQGPTLSFNLIRPDGTYVGFNEVSKLAIVRNIHLRTGGLCNPGGIMHWMKLDEYEMRENWASGKKCGDEWDIMRGKPTGAVRISFGAMSTFDDAAKFIEFIDEFFVQHVHIENAYRECASEKSVGYVKQITVFPIKSCAGYNIPSGIEWPLHPEGLHRDREFCLVDVASRRALNQKQYPQMTVIKPNLDDPDFLTLTCLNPKVDLEPLTLSLVDMDNTTERSLLGKSCESRVCGEDVPIWLFTDSKVQNWFTAAIGVGCTLARYCPEVERQGQHSSPIKLSNESPILVVNQDSVDGLNTLITAEGNKPASADVFRGNIIVSTDGEREAYAEDTWNYLQIGDSEVLQILGPCRRCQMVCIDQQTGKRNPEPFSTLSKTRKSGGAVHFGMHARQVMEGNKIPARIRGALPEQRTIKVGDSVRVWGKEDEVIEEVSIEGEKSDDEVTLVSNGCSAVEEDKTANTVRMNEKFTFTRGNEKFRGMASSTAVDAEVGVREVGEEADIDDARMGCTIS